MTLSQGIHSPFLHMRLRVRAMYLIQRSNCYGSGLFLLYHLAQLFRVFYPALQYLLYYYPLLKM